MRTHRHGSRWEAPCDGFRLRAMGPGGDGGPGRRGFGRGGPGRDVGGRGRKRRFEGGQLRSLLLLLMETVPRHGYDLIRDIESRTGGAYSPSPGVIYPTLTLLEELGHVETRALEGARKLYAITPAGAQNLAKNRAEAEAALARLESLRLRAETVDAGPIFRAMTNLKAVLHQRLSEQTEKETLFAAADIIDEAARRIERL